ncbi:LPS export ABC transporter ATP-binding protein [Pectinatus cerevisiiphilus]|uniref:Lipopolysaccharide export system ATP-binding protein n=1 Tax=Pectinatus cerevisiiphilus TaxID=86956 RepID=A0A4R3KBS6_9FIRM|nr:LPS export ABC transporter ATP-binding protein [Pectinatus cerevisiiphilus]TCS80475.1 lipopolysaccharide export system ATP-binding protein [Pectinatus cerevisiiphilus]
MNIEAKELIKTYKGRNVVNNISLNVEKGEIVGLLGPNGAGKTTTFYMIIGIERPTKGHVFLSDVDVTKMPMYKRAELGISYLAQESSIFRKLTVEDNLMAILETTSLTRKAQHKKRDELLKEFGLERVRTRKGLQLSGGERRRAEIARCLALEPQFILLDEPFAGIDPLAVADIQEIIAYLCKRGMGILITDHNVRETLNIVHRAYIMNEGKILVAGDSKTIANSQIAKKFYLGNNFTL